MPRTRSLLPRVRLIGAPMSSVSSCQFVEMLLNQIGKLQQQALPLVRLELAPRSFECPACGGDRAIDVLGIALGTVASNSPVAGLRVSKFLPEAASTHLPSMSIFL